MYILKLLIKMMGMKKEEASATGSHNTLAAGTTVKGDVVTDTDFRLDGRVEGNIVCRAKLVVGPKAEVVGNITTQNAEILGTVKGNMEIAEKVVLKASAVIEGDIVSRTIEVEPNARFNGGCRMTDDPAGAVKK